MIPLVDPLLLRRPRQGEKELPHRFLDLGVTFEVENENISFQHLANAATRFRSRSSTNPHA